MPDPPRKPRARYNRCCLPLKCHSTSYACGQYQAAEVKFAPLKVKYTRVMADAGPCGSWPKDLGVEEIRCGSRTDRTGISAVPRNAISPPWSTIPPISSSRAVKRRSMPLGARKRWTSTAEARTPPQSYPTSESKISDVGKMIKFNQQTLELVTAPEEAAGRRTDRRRCRASPCRRFASLVDTAGAVQGAAEDRRMAKAHMRIQMGGMPAALEAYRVADAQRHPDRVRESGRQPAHRTR